MVFSGSRKRNEQGVFGGVQLQNIPKNRRRKKRFPNDKVKSCRVPGCDSSGDGLSRDKRRRSPCQTGFCGVSSTWFISSSNSGPGTVQGHMIWNELSPERSQRRRSCRHVLGQMWSRGHHRHRGVSTASFLGGQAGGTAKVLFYLNSPQSNIAICMPKFEQ